MKAIPKDIAAILEIYDYNVIEQLNDWDKRERFFVYRLEKNGTSHVLKIANNGFERDLSNEVWWNTTLARLVEADPSIKVYAPRVSMSGQQFYIGEYFKAKPLIKSGFNFTPAEIDVWLERLAKMIVDFDQIALQPRVNQRAEYEDTNSAPYTNLAEKLDRWMELPIERKQIETAAIQNGKDIFDKYRANVTPRLQHGDFVPWHMYDLGEGKIGLIDGEHSSLTKPRLYDLAYIYSRLVTRMKSFKSAKKLLTMVVEQLPESKSELEKAWLPVITLRSFGMINDAELDLETTDYRQYAKQLLNMCFEEKISVFMEESS